MWDEVIGLFVDDGKFAATILLWSAGCGVALPLLSLPPVMPPIILFVGFAAILVGGAAKGRAARRAGAPPEPSAGGDV